MNGLVQLYSKHVRNWMNWKFLELDRFHDPYHVKKFLNPNKRDPDDSFFPGSVDGKSGENGGNIRGKIGENVFPWFT
jgi:hypothetical protein